MADEEAEAQRDVRSGPRVAQLGSWELSLLQMLRSELFSLQRATLQPCFIH